MSSLIPRRDILLRIAKFGLAFWASSTSIVLSKSEAARTKPLQRKVQPTSLSTLRAESEPGKWETFSHELEPKCHVYQCVEIILDQSKIGPGRDLVIVADVLTIAGEIKAPGQNITLVARQIISMPGAIIDCSGLNATPLGARAQDGISAGSPGLDGLKGDPGGKAGNISIICSDLIGELSLLAKGGDGATGQGGGLGQKGAKGPKGNDASASHKPTSGLVGFKGGQAGNGGPGGDGMDGGKILVKWKTGTAPRALALGGNRGEIGKPGDPGEGGDGGDPGEKCYTEFVPNPRSPSIQRFERHCDDVVLIPAPKGDSGDKASGLDKTGTPIIPGRKGNDITPILSQVDVPQLAPYVPITQLYMTLSQCENDFINRHVKLLPERFHWITAICQADDCGQVYDAERLNRLGQATPPVSKAEWNCLGARARVLCDRLGLGLDLFGYSPNYISPFDPKLLQDEVDKRIAIAVDIERAHNQYLEKDVEIKVQREQLQFALSKVSAQEQRIDALLSAPEQEKLDVLQNEIRELGLTLDNLRAELLSAEAAFQNAVRRQNGCDLESLAKFAAGVISIANGFAAGYAALASSLTTINSPQNNSSGIEALRFVGETFDKNKVGEHFKKMQEGFDTIQTVREAWEKNKAKVVVSLEAFEAQLQNYLNLNEAQQYRALLQKYVNIAQTRNLKQLRYTETLLRNEEAKVERNSLKLESDRIRNLIVTSENPALTECVVFLTKSLRQAKRSVLEILDLQRRSLVYTSLHPKDPFYRWDTVTALKDAQLSMRELWIFAQQQRNGTEQKGSVTFALNRKDHASFFKDIETKGWGIFSIPEDAEGFNDGGTAAVAVTEVTIAFPGIKAKDNSIVCSLVHSGNSAVKDLSGSTWNFVHKARRSILKYTFKKGQ